MHGRNKYNTNIREVLKYTQAVRLALLDAFAVTKLFRKIDKIYIQLTLIPIVFIFLLLIS